LKLSNHVSMDHVAIKGEPTTTLNFEEIGNKSSIEYHNEGEIIGFAEALDLLGDKRDMQTLCSYFVNFNQSLLGPHLSPMHYFKTKKGER
jgi:hypothetical protein